MVASRSELTLIEKSALCSPMEVKQREIYPPMNTNVLSNQPRNTVPLEILLLINPHLALINFREKIKLIYILHIHQINFRDLT
jgi:hypothetical protein